MRFQITTRTEFEHLPQTNPETFTDLGRAARFLYLQRTAFSGKPSGQNFAADKVHPARFDVTKLAPMLEDLHRRLTRVVIECLPYQDFIRRYDNDNTLFYLDPPYYRCEHDYGKDLFHRNGFAVLASPGFPEHTLSLLIYQGHRINGNAFPFPLHSY